jgi:molybdopterin biosynthesis enzyme
LAAIDGLTHPVSPREVEVSMALRRVLAADAVAAAGLPRDAVALRDGWAVRSDLVAEAGPYTPAPLMPSPRWVEVGDVLGDAADAVLAPDAVTIRDGMAEALAAAPPGDGVLPAQSDVEPRQVLRRAGERLRAIDIAVLDAARVMRVPVRVPDVRILCLNPAIDETNDTVAPLIARAVEADGGTVRVSRLGDCGEDAIAAALAGERADAVIGIGQTGMGARDFAVRALAQVGSVTAHGIGLIPGDNAAIGSIASRPVLLLPGRLDAALAAYLAIGRRMLSRLTGCIAEEPGTAVTLTRKLVSTVGVAEIALVRRHDGGIEPVATGVFPLHALSRADGYVLVPSEKEGYPTGAVVEMRSLP